MVKKRIRDAENVAEFARRKSEASSQHSEESYQTMPFSFEFFNFLPLDYEAVKLLLRQLFDVDAALLDLGAVADLVVTQDTIGSTVKDEEGGREEGDVFAFLSCLPLSQREGQGQVVGKSESRSRHESRKDDEAERKSSALRQLTDWVQARVGDGAIKDMLAQSQRSTSTSSHSTRSPALTGDGLGLLLCERLINCPAELAPPMYTCLLDELEAAVEDGEPYAFSHLLLVSRGWVDVVSQLDSASGEPRFAASGTKRRRRGIAAGAAAGTTANNNNNNNDDDDDAEHGVNEMQFFHDEDEIWARYALEKRDFRYAREGEAAGSDSRRAFREVGMATRGSVYLMAVEQFRAAVGELARTAAGGG